MRVLVVNTGSSSVKLRLVSSGSLVDSADPAPADLAAAVRSFGSDVDAVGHRVVHGGSSFTGPVVVDDSVRSSLESLVDLAPLHLPASLAGVDAVREAVPSVPSVACFDTAFHATLPPAAFTYAVPSSWRSSGVRKYGFHGLSHAYSARRAVEILGMSSGRLISCHLGAGASLCAIADGRSVDTTMGFTPLDGLVMATRSGTVDPGAVLWLQRRRGLSADEVSRGLEKESGLLGLAGTADMRAVVSTPSLRPALDVYLHRLRAMIGAMAATLGGVDAISFTGGVGEASPVVREGALAGLDFLGIAVDPGQNEAARGDADISAPGSPAGVAVVTAREDLEIAAQVEGLLS